MLNNSSISQEDVQFSSWVRNFYNMKSRKISPKGYEYARWFSSSDKIQQYNFSAQSINYQLQGIDFTSCLEIGCGPGTWTKLLLKKSPKADFICIDISKEMIRQFKKNIKEKNAKTVVKNFLEFDTKNRFDLVFASRSIEYIPNKRKVLSKFYKLLNNGGKGLVITSPPHPIVLSIKRLFGKKLDKEHSQRISVKDMKIILTEEGFERIRFYPILFSDFPILPTSFLFKKFYRKEWGLIAKMFASGYIVKFQKPK